MPEFPTLRHTISDIRMRYAPDRATAKGACSDFSYLCKLKLRKECNLLEMSVG